MVKDLQLLPCTLREANDFVAAFHRHSGRTSRNGGKWAVSATDGTGLIGVAIVGRPLARALDDGVTAEVTRCCVTEAAPLGTPSFLYAACWRAWRAMGGQRLVTYTLTTESGASLRGAGWKIVGESAGHKNGWHRADSLHIKRRWQPIFGQQKLRWESA